MYHIPGEPFEPSKGTRGMMERWKGARLAQKELKGQSKEKEKELKDKGSFFFLVTWAYFLLHPKSRTICWLQKLRL